MRLANAFITLIKKLVRLLTLMPLEGPHSVLKGALATRFLPSAFAKKNKALVIRVAQSIAYPLHSAWNFIISSAAIHFLRGA
jgi:hypothetical protein